MASAVPVLAAAIDYEAPAGLVVGFGAPPIGEYDPLRGTLMVTAPAEKSRAKGLIPDIMGTATPSMAPAPTGAA